MIGVSSRYDKTDIVSQAIQHTRTSLSLAIVRIRRKLHSNPAT